MKPRCWACGVPGDQRDPRAEGMGSIRNKRGRIRVLDRDKLQGLAGDGYQTAEDEHARVMTLPRA
jgi:hypothetical protein